MILRLRPAYLLVSLPDLEAKLAVAYATPLPIGMGVAGMKVRGPLQGKATGLFVPVGDHYA